MRVSAHQLVACDGDDVSDGEDSGFLADACQEDRLVEIVAELFTEIGGGTVFDCFQYLVGLFEDKWAQRG